jgi:hypothetical protein
MNFFKIILTLATVTMSSHAFGAWSLSSHYEKNPDSSINHSVVEFKQILTLEKSIDHNSHHGVWLIIKDL